jgi:poly(A) polymerase
MTTKEKATEICKFLQKEGHQAVLAGGCVRDSLLGIAPHDYDIATSAHPDEVKDIFSNIKEVGASFGVLILKYKEENFEIATFRTEGDYEDGRHPSWVKFSTMKEDASRRDFTINSIFYDPINDKYYDYFNGAEDLANLRLRFVGAPNKRIEEDHLRMLRAIRFATKYDLDLVGEDMKAIKHYARLINEIPAERIHDELIKLFSIGRSKRALSLLLTSNLLDNIFPEVSELQLTEQNPEHHPEGDTFTHTLLTLGLLENKDPFLHIAALLHDVGKPDTFEIINGKITNHGHHKRGRDISEEILTKLKFTNEEKQKILFLVENHMKPLEAYNMKKSTLKKLVATPYIEELVDLGIADAKSTGKKDLKMEGIKKIQEAMTWPKEEVKPKPLVDGNDLIQLGFKPGPLFKEILDKISDMQLEGEITSRDDALEVIRSTYG